MSGSRTSIAYSPNLSSGTIILDFGSKDTVLPVSHNKHHYSTPEILKYGIIRKESPKNITKSLVAPEQLTLFSLIIVGSFLLRLFFFLISTSNIIKKRKAQSSTHGVYKIGG
jgi:hypothetical protein